MHLDLDKSMDRNNSPSSPLLGFEPWFQDCHSNFYIDSTPLGGSLPSKAPSGVEAKEKTKFVILTSYLSYMPEQYYYSV